MHAISSSQGGVRDANANMSVRNEIKAGERRIHFTGQSGPHDIALATVLCPSFTNLEEFLTKRREDSLSFPVWWRVFKVSFQRKLF